MLTFTENGNDSITMERTKMIKRLYYYGTEGVEVKKVKWQKNKIMKFNQILIYPITL